MYSNTRQKPHAKLAPKKEGINHLVNNIPDKKDILKYEWDNKKYLVYYLNKTLLPQMI